MLEVLGKVFTVSGGLGSHAICSCCSTVFYLVQNQHGIILEGSLYLI